MHRADRQGIGAAFGGTARQLFQRQAVAIAAIAGAAQAVQLHCQAPAARWRFGWHLPAWQRDGATARVKVRPSMANW
jgi:hypothetical protein